jgi:4-amino-4-deoxy-L-arabinose transferase-like glycosyltransferase
MVFPLVVLVAVLPGLVALNAWDLTPPGPLWGLRGLAVLDGLVLDQVPATDAIKPVQEAAAYRMVAFQPPLYSWLEAALFWLGGDRDPMASVLPSYVAGALAVMLVYLHGRLWRGAGLGLIAAILVGFNQNLLLRMQEATPVTLALCGVLAVLLAYGWHERVDGEALRPPPWAGPLATAIAGGLAMGLALLSLGGLALIVVPIILLHQSYLRAGQPPAPGARIRRWRPRLAWRDHPGRLNALIASAIALAIALPWFVLMIRWHGWTAIAALRVPPERLPAPLAQTLLGRLVELAPVTLPLGLFGAVRAVRTALVDEVNSRESVGGALWVIWLVVAALVPAAWPHGPQSAFDLVLMVPLSLLAAQTIADLVNRRVPVRALIWLAPATAMSVAWWASADLRDAVDDVVHGRAEAATALGLHLALDLIIISVVLIRAVDHWARRRDDRQRGIIAVFLAAVLVVCAVDGVLEVVFRHGIDRDLLALRTMILRRNRENPFQVVAVLSPPGGGPALAAASASSSASDSATPGGAANLFNEGPSPGGRLRFILRTALPHLPQRDLSDIAELSGLPEGQRLVILAGTDQRLAGSERLRLGLEAIHPGRSGILDAYATARDRPKPAVARAGGQ